MNFKHKQKYKINIFAILFGYFYFVEKKKFLC